MSLIQLLECNDTLGTCCNDYALVSALDTGRKIMQLLQVIAPIVLIVMSSIELIRLMVNPELKTGLKGIFYKYFAAVVIFFIPIIVDAILLLLPETFSVSACWEEAKVSAEALRTLKHEYIGADDETSSPFIIDASEYNPGEKRPNNNSAPTGSGSGSEKGKAIVQYARQFVGQPYLFGGSWNGELPYTATDCSGFVQGVFRHNGISLPRSSSAQFAATNTYTLVTGEIKAGDLVMYNGHVGILTGNGNEIIHAKGKNYGVVADPDYTTCSSHMIRGIMRINGVN